MADKSIKQIARATGQSESSVIRFIADMSGASVSVVAKVGTSAVEGTIYLIKEAVNRKRLLG